MNLNGLWKNLKSGLLVQLMGDVRAPIRMDSMAEMRGTIRVVEGDLVSLVSLGILILTSVLPKHEMDIIVIDAHMRLDEGYGFAIWTIEGVLIPRGKSWITTNGAVVRSPASYKEGNPGTVFLEVP